MGSFQTSLLPIKYGVFGLYDTGRVWYGGEDSNAWHGSWGGGLFLVPWEEALTFSFTIAKPRSERAIISFTLGAPF